MRGFTVVSRAGKRTLVPQLIKHVTSTKHNPTALSPREHPIDLRNLKKIHRTPSLPPCLLTENKTDQRCPTTTYKLLPNPTNGLVSTPVPTGGGHPLGGSGYPRVHEGRSPGWEAGRTIQHHPRQQGSSCLHHPGQQERCHRHYRPQLRGSFYHHHRRQRGSFCHHHRQQQGISRHHH